MNGFVERRELRSSYARKDPIKRLEQNNINVHFPKYGSGFQSNIATSDDRNLSDPAINFSDEIVTVRSCPNRMNTLQG
jgi:hypothetical protein